VSAGEPKATRPRATLRDASRAALRNPLRHPWQTGIRLSSGAVIVLSVAQLLRPLDVETLVAALEQLDFGLGPATPLVFAAAYMVGALLLLPASAFALAAGALFGFWLGLAVTSAGSTVAAVIAFLIARHLLRESIARRAARFPRFAAVDHAIGRDGGTLVVLLRLMPGFPVAISNYLFGITTVRLRTYVLATFIGMLPRLIFFTLVGAVGRRSLSALTLGGTPSPMRLALMLAGAVVLGIVLVAIATRVKRLVAERLEEAHREIDEKRAAQGAPEPDDDDPALPASAMTTTLLAAAALASLAIVLWAPWT